MPATGSGLFEIKAALINNGWDVKVGDASLNEKGVGSKFQNTTTRVKYDTALRLHFSSTLSSNTNHGITSFNLSVVDNRSNKEVLNMVGNREDYVRYKPEDIGYFLVENLSAIQSEESNQKRTSVPKKYSYEDKKKQLLDMYLQKEITKEEYFELRRELDKSK